MSQVIPSPTLCCNPCTDSTGTGIPGPQGEAGENGSDGSNGVSPYTFVANYSPAAQPVMPAELGTVVVNVTSSTAAFNVNQFVFVAFWGYMKIAAIPSASSLTLQNPENTAASLYPNNAAPGTSLAAGSKITVAGEQGAAGANPANALLAPNNLSDVSNPATARTNLGLGSVATLTAGVANTNVPQIDDAGGIANGELLRGTATGIESIPAATARSALALGTMATQNAGAVNITGGALNGTLGATTPASVAATTIGASGATTLAGNLTAQAKTFVPASAVQSLAAGNAIDPNATFVRVAGSGGAVTLTSTPSISNPAADGQFIYIMGTSDANTLTLQDQSALGGSNLNLAGGANVTLGAGDILGLLWNSTLATWQECFRSNN